MSESRLYAQFENVVRVLREYAGLDYEAIATLIAIRHENACGPSIINRVVRQVIERIKAENEQES